MVSHILHRKLMRGLPQWSCAKTRPTAQDNLNTFISLRNNRAQTELAVLPGNPKLSYTPAFLK
jgi:hypothetical protein